MYIRYWKRDPNVFVGWYKRGTCLYKMFRSWTCSLNQQKIYVTESALQSYVTLMRFMIAVYCSLFQNKTFSSFSEWSVFMDECHPRRGVWRVFQLFLSSHLSCFVRMSSSDKMTPIYFLRLSKIWSILNHGQWSKLIKKMLLNAFIYLFGIFLFFSS